MLLHYKGNLIMNKILYFTIMTCIIYSQNAAPFRPGIDNPYEREEKILTDAELAEQLKDEDEKIEKKLQKKKDEQYAWDLQQQELKNAKEFKYNNLAKLKKLIQTLDNNFKIFVESNEIVKETLLIAPHAMISTEEKLLYCAHELVGDRIHQKNKENNKKYNKNNYLYNEKEIISLAIIIISIKDLLEAQVKEKAKNENPGIQQAMAFIIEKKLIEFNNDTRNELLHLLYFYSKEKYGELSSYLNLL